MIKGFGNSAAGCPSLSLALWADAWLRGDASPDAVLDGLAGWADLHLVTAASSEVADAAGLDWPGAQESGAVALLGLLRRLGEPTRMHLLLPAAGDTRGLTPGTDHTRDAISAGETLLLCPESPLAGPDGSARYSGVGLVPVREGRDVLRWAVYGLLLKDHPQTPQVPALGQARHDLREAVRDAAELFGAVRRVGVDPVAARTRIAQLTEDAHEHVLPATVSARVADVLDSATTVAAILTVAAESAGGDAATHSSAALTEESLRRLWGVVRTARLAAAHEVARSSAQSTDVADSNARQIRQERR